jgi:transitional endoplasmic reticulum ATPase
MGTDDKQGHEGRTEAITLRVVEAIGKDVGRAIGRLDPKDLARLGASLGDILAITGGGRTTVVKAMPAFAAGRGNATLQIDGVTRGNAKVALDDRVTVRKVSYQPAAQLTLKPIGVARPPREGDSRYMARLLEGIPLVAGDTVRTTLLGSRHQEFEVLTTQPRDTVVVHAQTQVALDGEPSPKAPRAEGVSYEDVGGLRKEIRRVREMIELPLRHPQVFERLGIEAPKGVLLHGPPGTGKTLLARAVAHETEANFISVSGPELIHKFYGESEAKLRALFDQARKSAPCILFLDELDAIAPKRENVQGEVEKRVVAQLLTLMDGLEGRGQVIVIGATNLPNSLDPALRRPGRFDREIEIGIPDTTSRQEILEIHSRGMPLADDVDIPRLAAATHGFVGADLEALCREAAMTMLREVIPQIDTASGQLPYEVMIALQVKMDHFLAALAEVEPSAIREVSVEVPDVKWEDIGGLESVKREIREAVEWPLKHAALLDRAGVRPSKGILLHGPPGTGKTLLAKAAASQSGINFISVKGPALLSMYVGESEKGVREIFKKARLAAPCIIFFDEVDALAPMRSSGGGGDGRVAERVISQLLTELDGVEVIKGVFIIAATNRKDMLDPALLRPGRIDLHVELPAPDRESREKIFAVHLRGKPINADVSAAELAQCSEGLTGADIEMICRRAALLAIRGLIDAEGEGVEPGRLHISRDLLLTALREQQGTTADRRHPSEIRTEGRDD